MNKFKTIFFHWQTFFLIPLAFLLWSASINLHGYVANIDSLVPYHGKVLLIDTLAQGGKKITKAVEIRLKISAEPNKFFDIRRLPRVEGYKDYILLNVTLGDTITIFTVPELFSKNGSADVIKIVKRGKVIIDYYKLWKEVSFHIFKMSSFYFLGFLLLYLLLLWRRLRRIIPTYLS